MKIFVNDVEVPEPSVDLEFRFPQDEDFEEEKLTDGNVIRYYYGFAETPLRHSDMQGFAVYARGKTAQAPPFFFNVENTASGQHGTKYLSGVIEADFLDWGTDDDDLISTDRQEIDWKTNSLLHSTRGDRNCLGRS